MSTRRLIGSTTTYFSVVLHEYTQHVSSLAASLVCMLTDGFRYMYMIPLLLCVQYYMQCTILREDYVSSMHTLSVHMPTCMYAIICTYYHEVRSVMVHNDVDVYEHVCICITSLLHVHTHYH